VPFIKIEYSSPSNIGVQGVEYFDVDPADVEPDGSVSQDVVVATWQHAVNEYMGDTCATVVENEGD
jgi:hypothetical protein